MTEEQVTTPTLDDQIRAASGRSASRGLAADLKARGQAPDEMPAWVDDAFPDERARVNAVASALAHHGLSLNLIGRINGETPREVGADAFALAQLRDGVTTPAAPDLRAGAGQRPVNKPDPATARDELAAGGFSRDSDRNFTH